MKMKRLVLADEKDPRVLEDVDRMRERARLARGVNDEPAILLTAVMMHEIALLRRDLQTHKKLLNGSAKALTELMQQCADNKREIEFLRGRLEGHVAVHVSPDQVDRVVANLDRLSTGYSMHLKRHHED